MYLEGDIYLASDPVFGVKKSLVVVSRTCLLSGELVDYLVEIDDEMETRKRGFLKGSKFKLLSYDFTLPSDAEAAAGRVERAK